MGKDSNIDKSKRDKAHRFPSNYYVQQINRVLQDYPNRYIYQVLVWNIECEDRMNALEVQYIRQLKPKFNFTNGGDGVNGLVHSEKTRQKISEGNKGKTLSSETKNKIGKANKGNIPWNKNKINVYSDEIITKMSKTRNTTGFLRVSKAKDKSYYQGFRWRYSGISNGKRIQIWAADLKTLQQKVENQGLEWKIINQEQAQASLLLSKKFSEKAQKNIQNKNSTGFYRVSKTKDNHCKQGFLWQYTYPNNGKRTKIRSVSLEKLEKRVKEKNLLWKIVNLDNALKSLKESRRD